MSAFGVVGFILFFLAFDAFFSEIIETFRIALIYVYFPKIAYLGEGAAAGACEGFCENTSS